MTFNLTFPLLVSSLAFILSACQISPLEVTSQSVNPSVLSKESTFNVQANSERKGPYLDLLTQSINEYLTSKGYQPSETPDFLVAYQVRFKEDTEIVTEIIPIANQVYNRQQLEAVFEAHILINAIDTATKDVLWKAASKRDLTQVSSAKYTKERADKAVSELFETFPVHE